MFHSMSIVTCPHNVQYLRRFLKGIKGICLLGLAWGMTDRRSSVLGLGQTKDRYYGGPVHPDLLQKAENSMIIIGNPNREV